MATTLVHAEHSDWSSAGRVIAAISLSVAVAFGGVLAVPAGATAASAPRHDYRMMGNLDDSFGGGEIFATDQVPMFAREAVDGVKTTVETFPEGGGFVFQPGRPDDGTYAIALLFRFDDVSSWGRVMGVQGLGDYGDNGLYVQGADLVWFYNGTSRRGRDSLVADEWVQIVISRNAQDVVRVYLNGESQIRFEDPGDEFSGTSFNTFWFFRDNDLGGGINEENSGAVKRIRQWETGLSADTVASLDRLPPASRILLDRTSAARTSQVTVTGRQWAPEEQVALTLVDSAGNPFPLGTGMTMYAGRFSSAVTVPQFATTGRAKIVAVGQESKDRRVRALTIT